MHIALAAREYAPDIDIGGIGSYTRHMTLALRSLGHRVTTIPDDSTASAQRSAGLPPKGRRLNRVAMLSALRPWVPSGAAQILWYSLMLAKKTSNIHAANPLDLLAVPEWGAEGLIVSLRRQVPLVVTLHTPTFVVQQYMKQAAYLDMYLVQWLEKQAVIHADLITCPSRSLANIVAREYAIPAESIHILRYPIDTELFSPGSQVESDRQTVLYVGKLGMRKGVHILAAAIPQVLRACPQAHFVFAGSDFIDPDTNRSVKQTMLRELTSQGVESQVTFLPYQNRKGLVSVYRSSVVCVVPSLYDNLPYACLEAMACGKAVVASRTGGLAEIIESDVNGMLVPPAQSEPLANAIIDLLDNPVRRRRLGECARDYVCEYLSIETIAKHTIDIYKQVI